MSVGFPVERKIDLNHVVLAQIALSIFKPTGIAPLLQYSVLNSFLLASF